MADVSSSSTGTQKDLYRLNDDKTIDHWWQDTAVTNPSVPQYGWQGPERVPKS